MALGGVQRDEIRSSEKGFTCLVRLAEQLGPPVRGDGDHFKEPLKAAAAARVVPVHGDGHQGEDGRRHGDPLNHAAHFADQASERPPW